MRERREIWGDQPEEVQASETIAEFASDVEVQRRWHEHPAWAPFRVVSRFIRRSGKRVGVTIVGFGILLVGLAGLVLPVLPGWALIIVGLAILATEYVWAQRMLRFARAKAVQARDAVLKKKRNDTGADEAPPSA